MGCRCKKRKESGELRNATVTEESQGVAVIHVLGESRTLVQTIPVLPSTTDGEVFTLHQMTQGFLQLTTLREH